ncbi:MAG TPA: protein-export chaperone SecB [Pseudomonadales bacterium]|nr:protein-export chaperone SecB [Pseudomonadales bacterium]
MSAAPEFALERIYVKDLSFESPRSPDVFRGPWQPQIHLDINTRTAGLGDERYEVVLTVTAHAKSAEGQSLMIVEVQQGGVFRIRGLDDERMRRVLATHCPGILFPYIRESIDALVVKGGFPALMLAPVNFDAMYEEALKQQRAATTGAPPIQH